MPEFNINEFGVITNPEIITIYSDKQFNEICIKIAEINGKFITGYKIECSSSFASSPCFATVDIYDSRDIAIQNVLQIIENYLRDHDELVLLNKVKKYRINNYTQLTLF